MTFDAFRVDGSELVIVNHGALGDHVVPTIVQVDHRIFEHAGKHVFLTVLIEVERGLMLVKGAL